MYGLLYDMGNLELTRDNLNEAQELYRKSFEICYSLRPTQLLMCSLYYKLSLAEAKLGNLKSAM